MESKCKDNNKVFKTTMKLSKIFFALLFAFTAPPVSAADGQASISLVLRVLNVVNSITDSAIVIIVGLGTLITVVAVVRSGILAQFNNQFGMKFGLSKQMILLVETVVIFLVLMIALPLVKSVIGTAVAKVGGNNGLLGFSLRYPEVP